MSNHEPLWPTTRVFRDLLGGLYRPTRPVRTLDYVKLVWIKDLALSEGGALATKHTLSVCEDHLS